MGAFYIIFSVVVFLMQLTVGVWFMRCYPQIGWKLPLLSSLLLTVVMYVGLTYTQTHCNGFWASVLYYFAYIWLGLVFLSFCICIGYAVLLILLKSFHVKTFWMGMASIGTILVVWALAFWGGFSAPKLKYISVNIPNAPYMKLALLSDTHLGMGVSLGRFDKVMSRIEAENPDGLFVLGDIFEYGPNREAYAKRLARTRTELGSVGVLGNHEYYVGYGDSKDFFDAAGIKLLENETTVLPNGVQVAGLKDIHTAHVTAQEVADVLDQLDPNKPTILLSHTPLHAEVAAAHGANLMLSGHTHNGQLWPFAYLVRMRFPRVYGLYDVNGMSFYITSGVFYWGIPLRFLAPAEIVILEVNAK